jgi:hypothetical protein
MIWPGEKTIGAGADAGDLVLHTLQAGEHKDGDQFGAAIRADAAATFRPVHIGDEPVNDDQVHGLPLQYFEGFDRSYCRYNAVPLAFE